MGSPSLRILVANSTFEGTFYLSQVSKVVDIPHREEKKDFFCGIFPHFLNSPPISFRVKPIKMASGEQWNENAC